MTTSFVKTLFASLVFIAIAKAQSNGNQMYSQLQGTHWSGEFQVKIKTKKGKVLKSLQKFPIEISFLKQQDENGIGYTFIKDVSKATKAEDRGFGELDSVPCKNSDGSQEPRHISLVSKSDGTYAGKINLNDCKPGKKGAAQKVAKELPISNMSLSNSSTGEKLSIIVQADKGIVLEISYDMKRVEQSELKIKAVPNQPVL